MIYLKPKVELCPITRPLPVGERSSFSPRPFTTKFFPWLPNLLEITRNWVELSLPHWSPCFQTLPLLSILHVGARVVYSKHNSDSYMPLPNFPFTTSKHAPLQNSQHLQSKSPSFLNRELRPLGSRLIYLPPPLPTHPTLPFLNTLCSLLSLNNVLFFPSAHQAPPPLEILSF